MTFLDTYLAAVWGCFTVMAVRDTIEIAVDYWIRRRARK